MVCLDSKMCLHIISLTAIFTATFVPSVTKQVLTKPLILLLLGNYQFLLFSSVLAVVRLLIWVPCAYFTANQPR